MFLCLITLCWLLRRWKCLWWMHPLRLHTWRRVKSLRGIRGKTWPRIWRTNWTPLGKIKPNRRCARRLIISLIIFSTLWWLAHLRPFTVKRWTIVLHRWPLGWRAVRWAKIRSRSEWWRPRWGKPKIKTWWLLRKPSHHWWIANLWWWGWWLLLKEGWIKCLAEIFLLFFFDWWLFRLKLFQCHLSLFPLWIRKSNRPTTQFMYDQLLYTK